MTETDKMRSSARISHRFLGLRVVAFISVLLSIKTQTVSCFSTANYASRKMVKGGLRIPTSFLPVKERARGDSILLEAIKQKEDTSTTETSQNEKEVSEKRSLLRTVVRIYTDYFARLWKDTNVDARKLIAADKAAAAIRRVEHIVRGEEYVDLTDEETEDARKNLLDACNEMLVVMEKVPAKGESAAVEGDNEDSTSSDVVKKKKKKKGRSVLFGATMGAVVAGWVFSGNYIFTLAFTLMTILGQLEYYRMVINTGVYPARRISVVGACSMFTTALFAPNLHQICLPMCGLWSMVWFLTMRREVSTIPEVATTFTGMFLLGYIPSFWVRTRLIGGGREPTRLAPITGPILERLGRKASSLPAFIPKSIHLPITTGAVFIFWSWLCIAFSDVGAYFVGRKYGNTKLGEIAPAAGATSPNKTVEGLFGGCVVSGALGVLGAWVQKWPYWIVTGAVHGVILALLGVIGDLTASMLKRDAGFKDFGDLIPEHGGIMDRVDSYIFTAPYSWLVCAYVIPALKTMSRARAALP